MTEVKVIVEKHPDGYVAYPLGCKGIVVGQGDTYDEAIADVKSAIYFHMESFGSDVLNTDAPVLEVFVAETEAEHKKELDKLSALRAELDSLKQQGEKQK